MTAPLLRGFDAFLALEARWRALSAAGAVRTPYQSFAWLEQWLRHRPASIEPFVLVLHDGDTIAPFGIVRQGGVRLLRLLGTPESDYAGLVTLRSPAEAWDAVARELRRRRASFDLVHLHSVRERDAIVHAFGQHLGGAGRLRRYETCPWIATEQDWDTFRATRGKPLRSELKRWERRLGEGGAATVERLRTPIGDPVLDEMAEMERHSWKWEQGDATFKPGAFRDFLQAVLRDARAGADVWLLRVDGALAAYAIVLLAPQYWCYYATSFRKDVPNAGAYLLSRIVQAACDSDCRTLDLLRGDHGYKRAWTDRADTVYEVTWPATLVGRAAGLGYAARWRAARSGRLQALRARLHGVGDRRA